MADVAQVCLGYLLEQSVTWIEAESDDDLHSPKVSVQQADEEPTFQADMLGIRRRRSSTRP